MNEGQYGFWSPSRGLSADEDEDTSHVRNLQRRSREQHGRRSRETAWRTDVKRTYGQNSIPSV